MDDEDEVAEFLDLMDVHLADEDIEPAEEDDEDLEDEWWEAVDPKAHARFADFRTAVGSLQEVDLHDPWQAAFTLSSTKRKKYGSGKAAIDLMDEWIDAQVARYFRKIAREEAKRKKKKPFRDTKVWWQRIDLLEDSFRALMEALAAGTTHGVDLLVLANVVNNEAGTSNDEAKRAVAYAWVSRKSGVVAVPKGAEISGYKKLRTLWEDLDDTGRLSFLPSFIASLGAAQKRLDDPTGSKDPTGGATHWVSPKGLSKYDASKHDTTRYKRTIGAAADRAFPLWARDPSTSEAKAIAGGRHSRCQLRRDQGPRRRSDSLPVLQGRSVTR